MSKEFDFDLKGVIIDDDVRTALFRPQADGQIVRLTEGDEIEGWTLLEVELDFVVMERDGKKEVLELAFDDQLPADTDTRQDNTNQ